jgi:hypothetical protein
MIGTNGKGLAVGRRVVIAERMNPGLDSGVVDDGGSRVCGNSAEDGTKKQGGFQVAWFHYIPYFYGGLARQLQAKTMPINNYF